MNLNQLEENIISKKTFLCLGLDTDIDKIPKHLLAKDDPVFQFNKLLVDRLSNKIAAVAPVSGLMWDEAVEQCNPTHPTSLISFNGTSDFERPYNGMDYMSSVNEILNYWVEFNDTDSIPIITSFQSSGLETEHYIYESGLNNVSIEHYKFINGGHHWFEMDNDGINIDEIIWNFVSKYDLNGLIE